MVTEDLKTLEIPTWSNLIGENRVCWSSKHVTMQTNDFTSDLLRFPSPDFFSRREIILNKLFKNLRWEKPPPHCFIAALSSFSCRYSTVEGIHGWQQQLFIYLAPMFKMAMEGVDIDDANDRNESEMKKKIVTFCLSLELLLPALFGKRKTPVVSHLCPIPRLELNCLSRSRCENICGNN